MTHQINHGSFVGDHPDDIIANISWDLNKPLDDAYLFIDKDYDNENIIRFGDNNKIYSILETLYLKPKTFRFVINLWTYDNDPVNIKFHIPNTSSQGVSYLQILEVIENFMKNEPDHRKMSPRYSKFIRGIYERPDKYSKIKGPYLELDYFD